jgi:DivIVA domain-containing protein
VIWVFAVVVVLAMGAIALVASGRGEPMVDEHDDRPDALVPATGDLTGADVRRVRFSLVARGYRMSEVDALLTRLAAQLDAARAWQPDEAPYAEPETETRPGTAPVEEPEQQPATERRDDDTRGE